jgi:hypothetical protein
MLLLLFSFQPPPPNPSAVPGGAEGAVYALLSAAPAVTALVGDRIYPGQLPEGEALPALVIEHISSVRLGRLDAQAPTHPTQARVQVNLLAASYPALKALRPVVMAALQFQRGAVGGGNVIGIWPDAAGPDLVDHQLGALHQPLDFMVVHEA